MGSDIPAITFEIETQRYVAGRFTVPMKVCKRLGLKPGNYISLTIGTPSGTRLFAGVKKLASGTEIYGAEIRKCVKAGERIEVTASRPQRAKGA